MTGVGVQTARGAHKEGVELPAQVVAEARTDFIQVGDHFAAQKAGAAPEVSRFLHELLRQQSGAWLPAPCGSSTHSSIMLMNQSQSRKRRKYRRVTKSPLSIG